MTYYSPLEQHLDGNWWYHRKTFTDKKEVEEYVAKWIWWDTDRPKTILEHYHPLPDETLYTKDFITFYAIGGEKRITLE